MKQIRKIIIVILSFSMLFRTANIAYATTVEQSASNNLLDKSRIESLKQYAEDFIAENNSNEQIISTYELYNLNDEVVAMLYNLSTGYIIVNIKDFSIPEFSFESNSCYSNDNSKKYYNGGLEYYEERTSGSLVDLYDEQEVSKTELDTTNVYGSDDIVVDVDMVKSAGSDSNELFRASSSQTFSLKHTLPNYSYNNRGICGANAAAMYLRYLDLYHDSNIIPNNLYSEKLLIDYLETYIPSGAYSGQVYFGIMEYYSDQGITRDIFCSTMNSGDVVRCLTSDTPYIAGFIPSSSLGAHWATGYSYKEYSSGTQYLIINDGHGRTGVYMDITQSDFIIG
ncbi:MAG: hypothetical protein ACFWTJ_02450 [Lachnoclostridium sp.]